MTSPIDRRALLLDLDGTLADSLPAMRLVYARFLDGFRVVATEAEFAYLNGPPLAQGVRLLKETHNLPDSPDALLARYHALVDRAFLDVLPTAGSRALLAQARTLGYIVGVVTSNSARRTRDWLDRAGLIGFVDLLVAGEDVLHGKPDPEPYLLASALAGCCATTNIAVEDSQQGARSARNAGLRTFVLDPDPGSGARWPEGVERIPSLSHLTARL